MTEEAPEFPKNLSIQLFDRSDSVTLVLSTPIGGSEEALVLGGVEINAAGQIAGSFQYAELAQQIVAHLQKSGGSMTLNITDTMVTAVKEEETDAPTPEG